ncbi:protein-tyrosine phosphatase-like protein [Mycotypha africana]|uniref:protein-tyrosine phosphatase-like protein n=1 Tax=Mycotypha africana TaxID=64632 RepID=UPI002300ABF8|nr:protein-tyrosine phosphatase-like protein [Mycotypha africana]KAI8987640.1 protein-tyrosine phosphatase-like protein [Mycotypha africana]
MFPITSILNEQGEYIKGILVEKTPIAENNRLVLLLHGEQGHKDALYQPVLAERLPFSSFRFDFHGCGDSEGKPDYGRIARDVDDIRAVVAYFEGLGYEIFAIIGYSKGSLSGLKYATSCEKPLSHYINIAAPYNNKSAVRADDNQEWKVYREGELMTYNISSEELELYQSWDNSHVIRMPLTTCVHTIHGIKDTAVSASHAADYANSISNHTLTLIPDADHEFTGQQNALITTIVEHFEQHERDAYQKALSMRQHVSVCIPRWIDIPGVKNFRDIGGWPLKDGSGYIRERIVFRCGHLVNITDEGIRRLKRLNVIAAFDFRSDPEIEKQGIMPEIEGIIRYPSAMFTKADFSPTALASRWMGYFEGPSGFPKVYAVILEKAAVQYRKIFLHLIEHHSVLSTNSIIVHCTAGKDRTGIFVMLLLGMCGVDEEIIANEYALSNLGYWEPEAELEKKAKMLNVTVDDMRMVMSAPYFGMKETIRQMKEKYGSIEGYIRDECKLTTEEIQKLKDLMIVPIRFEERQLYRPRI